MFPHGQVAAIAGTVGQLNGKRTVTGETATVLERLALEYGPNWKKVTAKDKTKRNLLSAACGEYPLLAPVGQKMVGAGRLELSTSTV